MDCVCVHGKSSRAFADAEKPASKTQNSAENEGGRITPPSLAPVRAIGSGAFRHAPNGAHLKRWASVGEITGFVMDSSRSYAKLIMLLWLIDVVFGYA
jgi:hypothetical protein